MSNIFALELNSTSNFYIKFYPGIKTSIGCEKATLVLGRLEYWFERYKAGFYKFIEPCAHPLYREGDSWLEEVGFSRKAFAKAFDLVGVRYKSKSAFKKAEDKFQGKLYASYHDRKTNQTYFVRNHQFASEFLNSLFKSKKKQPTGPIKSKKTENIREAPLEAEPIKKGRSWNSQKSRSYGGTIGGKENNSIQRNTPSLEHTSQKVSSTPSSIVQTQETEGMIKIWKEEVGDLGVSSISDNLMKNLAVSLKQFFNQSLDQWQSYCQMISSSKFLMGEAHNKFFKKAWITWAIKEEVIERVRGGGFNLGDRETKLDEKINQNQSQLENLNRQKQVIEEKINDLKTSVNRKRHQKIKEKINDLSPNGLTKAKGEYEKSLEAEGNALSEEFKARGWNGAFIEAYFLAFLEERMEKEIFTLSLEDETKEVLENSCLLGALQQICEEISHFRRKRSALIEKKATSACPTPFFQLAV